MSEEKHTVNSLLNLIYNIDLDLRQQAVFMCDIETSMDLRRVHDGDGRYILDAPPVKGEPTRILGYPLHIHRGYEGLTFGPLVPPKN